jgi:hypothetical protein
MRAIMNYFLHKGIENSDIKVLSVDVKKTGENFVIDISTSTVIATKGQEVRKDAGNRNLILVFLVSLSIMIIFILVGFLLPPAEFGRTLVYLSVFPGIAVNTIATRYIIKYLS